MSRPAPAAVVPHWRTPGLAGRAVASLVADGLPADRIAVVDDGSPERELAELGSALPAGARLLRSAVSHGFARAVNRGAAEFPDATAYLIVNSDTEVRRAGSVARLIAAVGGDHAVAVPRLVDPDGTLQPSVVPLSRPLPELVRASGLSRLVPDRLQPRLGTHWSHDRTRTIEAATGAVLAVRRELWRSLGGLDEREFMYGEDLDLFWRVHRRGEAAVFVAEAEFLHVGGVSTSARWTEAERAARVAAAEAAMLRRHLRAPVARATLAVMWAGSAGRAAVRARLGEGERAAVHRASAEGYRSPPAPRQGPER